MKKYILLVLLLCVCFVQAYHEDVYTQEGKEIHSIDLDESELPLILYRNLTFNNTRNYTVDLHVIHQQFIDISNYSIVIPSHSYGVFYYNISIPQGTVFGIYETNITFINLSYNISLYYIYKFYIMRNESILYNVTWEFTNYSGDYFKYIVYDVELPWKINKTLYVRGEPDGVVHVECQSPIICSYNNITLNSEGMGVITVYIELDSTFNVGEYVKYVTLSAANKSANITFEIVVKKAPVVIQKYEYVWNRTFENMSVEELREFYEWQNEMWQRRLQELMEANKTVVKYKNRTVEVGVPIIVDRAFNQKILNIDAKIDNFIKNTNLLISNLTTENDLLRRENAELRKEINKTIIRMNAMPSVPELKEQALKEIALSNKKKRETRIIVSIIVVLLIIVLIITYFIRRNKFGIKSILG